MANNSVITEFLWKIAICNYHWGSNCMHYIKWCMLIDYFCQTLNSEQHENKLKIYPYYHNSAVTGMQSLYCWPVTLTVSHCRPGRRYMKFHALHAVNKKYLLHVYLFVDQHNYTFCMMLKPILCSGSLVF